MLLSISSQEHNSLEWILQQDESYSVFSPKTKRTVVNSYVSFIFLNTFGTFLFWVFLVNIVSNIFLLVQPTLEDINIIKIVYLFVLIVMYVTIIALLTLILLFFVRKSLSVIKNNSKTIVIHSSHFKTTNFLNKILRHYFICYTLFTTVVLLKQFAPKTQEIKEKHLKQQLDGMEILEKITIKTTKTETKHLLHVYRNIVASHIIEISHMFVTLSVIGYIMWFVYNGIKSHNILMIEIGVSFFILFFFYCSDEEPPHTERMDYILRYLRNRIHYIVSVIVFFVICILVIYFLLNIAHSVV